MYFILHLHKQCDFPLSFYKWPKLCPLARHMIIYQHLCKCTNVCQGGLVSTSVV